MTCWGTVRTALSFARSIPSPPTSSRNTGATLLSDGHDAYVPVRKSEFDSPAVNVPVEALRSANDPHDRVVLRRLCLAWEGLTSVVVDPHSVEATAALVGGNFLRAWVRSADATG